MVCKLAVTAAESATKNDQDVLVMASTQSHLTKERLFVDANGRPKPGLVVVPPGMIRNWPRTCGRGLSLYSGMLITAVTLIASPLDWVNRSVAGLLILIVEG